MKDPTLTPTLYAAFTQISKFELMCLFKHHGWLVRKSSWTDYELENEWSALELDGPDSAPLLHGLILYTEPHWIFLTELLVRLVCPCQVEVYREDGMLLCEYQRG